MPVHESSAGFLSDGGRNEKESTTSAAESVALWGWDDDGVLWTSDSVSASVVLEPLRTLGESERVPSREVVREYTAFHPAVYVRKVGSFTAALERADALAGRREGVLDEEVMEELDLLAERLGRSPTPNDITEEFIVSVDDVLSRFGRWNNALYEAGVEKVFESDLTEDEQFLLYNQQAGDYRGGFGEFGFLSGWSEHHAVLEFLRERGEQRFTASEFATALKQCDAERAREMLEFVNSLGFVRRDSDGWSVRIDEQENVAGWLRRGKGL